MSPPNCKQCSRPTEWRRQVFVDGRLALVAWCARCDAHADSKKPYYSQAGIDVASLPEYVSPWNRQGRLL